MCFIIFVIASETKQSSQLCTRECATLLFTGLPRHLRWLAMTEVCEWGRTVFLQSAEFKVQSANDVSHTRRHYLLDCRAAPRMTRKCVWRGMIEIKKRAE